MLEWILKKFTSSFQQFIPNVRADDSEEMEDPQTVLRNECQNGECSKFFQQLETCNARVRSKKKTAETCDEEMIDFINCVDHCASKTLFTKLNNDNKISINTSEKFIVESPNKKLEILKSVAILQPAKGLKVYLKPV